MKAMKSAAPPRAPNGPRRTPPITAPVIPDNESDLSTIFFLAFASSF